MPDTCRLNLKLSPGAKSNSISGYQDGVLSIRIKAPPVEGKANQETIAFLSHELGTARSNINIVRGLSSKNKVIVIAGFSLEEALAKLGIET
ncbi:MAG: DUF167 domain-containing protein [Dehalococcoidaceae bacterium]|nr:DUF167 domain-containing protein [Dehalococcoidaceae bacterium]